MFPPAVTLTDLLAPGADRQEALQRLDRGERFLQLADRSSLFQLHDDLAGEDLERQGLVCVESTGNVVNDAEGADGVARRGDERRGGIKTDLWWFGVVG